MHKSSRSLGRRTSDEATSIDAVTDAIEVIAAQFDTSPVSIAVVEPPTASTSGSSETASSFGSPGAVSAEAPTLTRRELREREARDARASAPAAAPSAPPVAPAVDRRVAPAAARAFDDIIAPNAEPSITVEVSPSLADAVTHTPRPTSSVDDAEADPPATRRSASAARRSSGSRRAASAPRSRGKAKGGASRADARRSKAPRPTLTGVPAGKPRGGAKRGILSRLATIGTMSGVGLILIATTVPANAFVRPNTAQDSSVSAQAGAGATQEMEVQSVAAPAISRDAYTIVPLARQVQAKFGSRVMSFTNNPNGTIQWPFLASPITSGFGSRQVAGCGFCSTNHKGLDFNPGSGTPIGSVSAGVVSLVTNERGGLGSHVIVDHVINGQEVQSVYAHMQYGSIAVATGQTVVAGQTLGLVGSTGASTGAHLHLEIHLDGTPVDPYSWLQANAN